MSTAQKCPHLFPLEFTALYDPENNPQVPEHVQSGSTL